MLSRDLLPFIADPPSTWHPNMSEAGCRSNPMHPLDMRDIRFLEESAGGEAQCYVMHAVPRGVILFKTDLRI